LRFDTKIRFTFPRLRLDLSQRALVSTLFALIV
jgi:hypothetical protein